MAASFYFYDLETSGTDPRSARVMQFAGQRTDLNLEPTGEPHDILVALTPDVLPEPDAILITGITPQKSISEGLSEVEFLKIFEEEINIPGTIFVGFNSVRFDDEFIRFMRYRNFYDAYDWQWQDGRSRWDILDVVRMTRALRPEGIVWPFAADGSASNRLELLTSVNKLSHEHAHDALSDVHATISVAKMIRDKQPKLFSYLLELRDKKKIAEFVAKNEMFVYCSGKYQSEYEKTTVVGTIGNHPSRSGAVLVYDLRVDPEPFLKMSVKELVEAWKWKKDATEPRLPVKTLQYNRCPAVAPLSVLDEKSSKRLAVDIEKCKKHLRLVKDNKELYDKLCQAIHEMDKARQASLITNENEVDKQLYDGFFEDEDKTAMRVVRAAEPEDIKPELVSKADQRLKALLPLYKARNFSKALSDEERAEWEAFCSRQLMGGGTNSKAARYFGRLQEIAQQSNLTPHKQYLLEELQLYGQSMLPSDDV